MKISFKKKLLSFALSLILIIAVIPFGTFTVSAETYSGTCGDNLTWEYNSSTDTLTISGTGDMYNYDYNTFPWYSYRTNIKTVNIGNGITSIGYYAFYGCTGLTSVTIGDGVTSIGDYAFYYCTGLTSITIPNSVTSIGSDAFESCSGLTSITIPNSVTSIGKYAFFRCTELTSVTIGDGATSIGEYAFTDCTGLTSVTIGNSVTSIGDNAFFGCTNLNYNTYNNALYLGNSENLYIVLVKPTQESITSCIINSNTKFVYSRAFSNCHGLTSITVDNGNHNYYGEGNCLIDKSTNTLILGCKNSVIPNSVTSIGKYAFDYCTGLTSITIPNSVTSIGRDAFSGCTGLTSITIPNSVTSIGRDAFSGCTGLTSITIPNSVTSIGKYAFFRCTELTSVTIGDGATSIGDYAFYECAGLTSITIPNSVTSIGDYAFSGCTGLTSVTIPSSIRSIGYNVFIRCTNLNYNTYNNALYLGNSDNPYIVLVKPTQESITSCIINSNTKFVYSRAFSNCHGLTSITMPDGVTSIGSRAFYYCTGLTSITIPNSVTSIGSDAFESCTNLNYNTYNNALYLGNSENPYIVLVKATQESITSYFINSNTKFIHSDAFLWRTGLTSITIPNSVTSIGKGAFCDCTGLKNVIYCGTQEQKNKISIDVLNYSLLNAAWTYHTSHTYQTVWSKNSTNHWHECSVCGDKTDNGSHIYDNVCDATCNTCGYVRTITHSYKSAWSNNSTNHWHECSVCGDKKDTANHIYDNDCDTTCNVCGYTRTVPHDYVNGKCTLCDSYNSSVVASGVFTSGAKWYVNSSTKALYIYGNGETDKYKTSASAPWYANRSIITKVYVESTITKLGNLSFDCLSNLQSVYFDTKDIIFGYCVFPEKSNLTIYGISGGTIEAYANNSGITFSKYANTNTPISPIVLSAENRNITVQAVSGYEYSIDGINFQDSNIFTNVDGDKILTVCQRIKETDKYKCSATSTKTKVIFITAPKIKLKGATKIEVATISGYEYSLDEIEWQSTAVFNKLIPEEEYTLYVRLKNSSGVTVVNLAQDGVDFTTGEFDSISDIPLTAQRMTFLINSLLSSTNEMASDVNGDKKIDILDLVALKKQIAGVK